MIKTINRVLCLILVLSLLGCNNNLGRYKSTTTVSTKSNKKNIALVVKTLTNPFFVDMETGARRAEQELGINLSVKSGAQETSIEQQISIIEDLINSKVDGIVIAPGSSTELIPILKKAQDAKILIVNIDNRLDPVMCEKIGLKNIPFISVNNEQAAYESAKYISDFIKKPTEVAILEGIRKANNSEERKNGALRAFKENKNIKVVAMETANWKIDEAKDITAKIFGVNPNIRAMFCANDMMALGAIEYIDKNVKEPVKIASFDALAEVKKSIVLGKIMVTIDQQADLQGYYGVSDIYKLINGERVEAVNFIPAKVIDAKALK